ncbi:hypothetical protein NPIL_154611, partial [Nephila pilipes]
SHNARRCPKTPNEHDKELNWGPMIPLGEGFLFQYCVIASRTGRSADHRDESGEAVGSGEVEKLKIQQWTLNRFVFME